MFTAALFTVAKTWKQLKFPFIDDQIKKMGYLYTMEYYSTVRKNEILPFATTYIPTRPLANHGPLKQADWCLSS